MAALDACHVLPAMSKHDVALAQTDGIYIRAWQGCQWHFGGIMGENTWVFLVFFRFRHDVIKTINDKQRRKNIKSERNGQRKEILSAQSLSAP